MGAATAGPVARLDMAVCLHASNFWPLASCEHFLSCPVVLLCCRLATGVLAQMLGESKVRGRLITLKELEPLIEAKYRCVELTWEQQVDFAWDLASALSACA